MNSEQRFGRTVTNFIEHTTGTWTAAAQVSLLLYTLS